MVCTKCQGTEFRLSGFRFSDLKRLAVLQYPVRCRNCHRRTYGSWLLALFLLQLRRHHFSEKDQA